MEVRPGEARTAEVRMAEVRIDENRPAEVRLDEVRPDEVRKDFGILRPPGIPNLDTFLELGEMFWVGHFEQLPLGAVLLSAKASQTSPD